MKLIPRILLISFLYILTEFIVFPAYFTMCDNLALILISSFTQLP